MLVSVTRALPPAALAPAPHEKHSPRAAWANPPVPPCALINPLTVIPVAALIDTVAEPPFADAEPELLK
jgi:hypothetical protein